MLQNSTRSLRFHQKIPKHSTTRLEKFIVFFYWRNYDHFYEYSERLFFPREISRAKHSKNSSGNWPFKFSNLVGISTGPDSFASTKTFSAPQGSKFLRFHESRPAQRIPPNSIRYDHST